MKEENSKVTNSVRYELIDKDGNSAGTFINALAASENAKYRWPDQEQDPERTGAGWDIQIAGTK